MWAVYVEFSSSSYQTRPCDEERVIQKSANETSDRTQAVQLSDRTRTQTSGAEPLSRKVIKSCSGSYRMLSDVLNGPAATTRLRPSAPQSLYSFIHLLPKWHTDKKTRQKPKNTRQKAKKYYLLNVQSTVVLNYVLQCTSESAKIITKLTMIIYDTNTQPQYKQLIYIQMKSTKIYSHQVKIYEHRRQFFLVYTRVYYTH